MLEMDKKCNALSNTGFVTKECPDPEKNDVGHFTFRGQFEFECDSGPSLSCFTVSY